MKRYLTACVLLASMLCSCSKGTTIETITTSAATSVSSAATETTVSETPEETTAAAAFDIEEEYNEIYASEVEFDTENIVDIYWFSNVTQEDINLSYCTFADSVG